MYTYQMVGLADQNDRTYECEYGTYSKEDGFTLNDDALEIPLDGLLDTLFHKDMWKLMEPKRKKMTIEDIERELGYRIQIVDPEYSKPVADRLELSDDEKKEIDDIVDWWRKIIGH